MARWEGETREGRSSRSAAEAGHRTQTHGAEKSVTSCLLAKNSYPSSTTWCARQMRSMSCFWRKRETTSGPNVNETPRSFSDQPVMSLSGSDQRRSQRSPERVWGG